jgi:hypothetical protein
MLQRLASDKQSNLLGVFVSYKENEVFILFTFSELPSIGLN